MKKYGRTDKSQDSIVSGLRSAGCCVMSLASAPVAGCPDLLVNRAGKLYLLECKSPGSPSRRKLTPHQVRLHKDWPVSVVTNVEESLIAVGVFK